MSDLPAGHALVVGINTYAGGISPLRSAVGDAQAIAAALQTHHQYKVTLLVDEQAGAGDIAHQLEEQLPQALNEESSFLLYFAGHGIARGDGSEGPKGFLIPHGAAPGRQDTWLSMDRVREALQALPCKHLIVILDCCFAGSFRWAATRAVVWDGGPLYDSQYERFLQGTAWQALTSASHDEKALDISPGRQNTRDGVEAGGHSPFAAALLRGLGGDADSSRADHEADGVITATELYQYVFEELVPPGAPSHQTPGIWPLKPDNTGQFIFRNPKKPKKTIPDPPLDDTNNPWLGLKSYSSEDAPLFFGRERVIAELIDWVVDESDPRFVAVVGASGTGKSSVIKAGLLPRLLAPTEEMLKRGGRWTIVKAARLSGNPMEQLDAALEQLGKTPAANRRLLFFDQFEELYTRCHDQALRDNFLRRLRKLVDDNKDMTVLVTLRSDFEPRPASSLVIGDLWAQGRFLVPALDIDEFRDCIVGPAQVKAIYFEPDELIDSVLGEVMAMPGGLPMLSFALSEMYQCAQARRRKTGATDRALTQEDYDTTGGVVGALHRRASQLYTDSDPDVQATIRRIFLRMLAQDGARITRRRIHLSEVDFSDVDEQARVKQVIDRYVNARLLVVDGEEIEPAHDTLVVAWEKLLDWLSESGPQVVIRAAWRTARDWLQNKYDKGMLWHDNPRLPLARERWDELNALERKFVTASEKRRKSLRRRKIGWVTMTAVLVVGIGGYAADQASNAFYARQTRDEIYLGLMERGNFFRMGDVLPDDAQGGVVEFNDNEIWWTLVDQPEGAFVGGRVYGKGRVMALGHEALIAYADEYEEALFTELALYWLVGERGNVVMFSSIHEEALPIYHPEPYDRLLDRLMDWELDIDFVQDLADGYSLSEAAVLIVGNAWGDFTPEEIAAVEEFVDDGGGLLAAGLGWSWVENGDHGLRDDPAAALAAYPMNKLMAPYGVRWTDRPIFIRD